MPAMNSQAEPEFTYDRDLAQLTFEHWMAAFFYDESWIRFRFKDDVYKRASTQTLAALEYEVKTALDDAVMKYPRPLFVDEPTLKALTKNAEDVVQRWMKGTPQ